MAVFSLFVFLIFITVLKLGVDFSILLLFKSFNSLLFSTTYCNLTLLSFLYLFKQLGVPEGSKLKTCTSLIDP